MFFSDVDYLTSKQRPKESRERERKKERKTSNSPSRKIPAVLPIKYVTFSRVFSNFQPTDSALSSPSHTHPHVLPNLFAFLFFPPRVQSPRASSPSSKTSWRALSSRPVLSLLSFHSSSRTTIIFGLESEIFSHVRDCGRPDYTFFSLARSLSKILIREKERGGKASFGMPATCAKRGRGIRSFAASHDK